MDGAEVLHRGLPTMTSQSAVTMETSWPTAPVHSVLPLIGAWESTPELALPSERGQKEQTTFRTFDDILQAIVELDAL